MKVQRFVFLPCMGNGYVFGVRTCKEATIHGEISLYRFVLKLWTLLEHLIALWNKVDKKSTNYMYKPCNNTWKLKLTDFLEFDISKSIKTQSF